MSGTMKRRGGEALGIMLMILIDHWRRFVGKLRSEELIGMLDRSLGLIEETKRLANRGAAGAAGVGREVGKSTTNEGGGIERHCEETCC
ncbi:hypothetical protein BCON_0004g01060 [Botryotinia convoluta]|uniref:Uncharacterized protein n=1 Tax=Botryotinia convoluta TaxID=54673 RepID=A0A4Z1J860_9HELO|nr:hypothetical protein BCON_0004g01060 [Botryotinia convoluta]